MATPLEKRKTIFNNGVPKYTKTQQEYETALLGQTPSGKGIFNPKSLPVPPQYQTLQQVVQGGQNFYVDKLNKYNYQQRFNDVLAGDTRDRSDKYPPDVVIHKIGQTYLGSSFDDRFIRGGTVQALSVADEDVNRISRFMVSGKGVLWILREQGLQMANPRPETRLYNPATTLLQVAGVHLGLHLPRHGLNPFNEGQGFGILDFGYNTYSTVKDYEPASRQGKKITGPFTIIPRANEQSKLLDLVSELHMGKEFFDITNLSLSSLIPKITGENVSKYSPPRDKAAGGLEINTIAYQAAANAPYGGFNLFGGGMHRAVNTLRDLDGKSINQYPREGENSITSNLLSQVQNLIKNPIPTLKGAVLSEVSKGLGGLTKSLSSALPSSLSVPGGLTLPIPGGSSLPIPGGTSIPTPNLDLLKTYKSLSYGELGMSDKVYISSTRDTLEGPSGNYKIYGKTSKRKPSTRGKMLINRGLADPGNPMSIDGDKTAAQPQITGEVLDNPYDLIPLIFYDIKNDHSLVFRAVLSAITDTITPEWNEYNYIGNPQTYYTYKRTTRDFGFTFKIYTETESELKWNWTKLNRFVGMLYPSYADNRRMIGPFLRLTLGDMLYRVPGYMSALSITIDDNTPWEINLLNDPNLAKLPHIIECAVTYRIVGDKPLDAETTPFYAQYMLDATGPWGWNKWNA